MRKKHRGEIEALKGLMDSTITSKHTKDIVGRLLNDLENSRDDHSASRSAERSSENEAEA